MNDDVIADLKQFISATISQQSSGLRDDIIGTLREDIAGTMRDDIIGTLREDIQKLDDKLSAKIDDLSSSVAEALDNHGEATQSQLDEHEQRITRLEVKTA
jgi:polyhydroxyalkanoate synthesis regulator phasin